jgi:HEAT repeat protein
MTVPNNGQPQRIRQGWIAPQTLRQLKPQGIRLVLLGRREGRISTWNVPYRFRFQPTEGRRLVEELARHNDAQVIWLHNGTVALVQRGAADEDIAGLRRDLASGNQECREHAAWRARWLEDVRVIEPLLAAAKDASPTVRRYAITSLAAMDLPAVACFVGDEIAWFLRTLLTGDNEWWRKGAARALRELGSGNMLPLLEIVKEDRCPDVRLAAVSLLAELPVEMAAGPLSRLCSDSHQEVRQWALRHMAENRWPGADELAMKALGDPAVDVRGDALLMYAKLRGQEALPAIEKFIADENSSMRRCATAALRFAPGARAFSLLERALADDSSDVAWSAAEVLMANEDVRARELLESARAGANELLRRGIRTRISEELDDQKTLDAAERMLVEADAIERGAICRTLSYIGTERAIAILEGQLQHPDLHGEGPYSSLARIGGDRCAASLERALSNPDAARRASAAAALGFLDRDRAIALLDKALDDPDASVRLAAGSGVAWVRNERALPLYRKALGSADFRVRQELVHALGLIGTAACLPLVGEVLSNLREAPIAVAMEALEEIGGDRTLELVECLLDHASDSVRLEAMYGAVRIGGPRSRNLLRSRLALEQDADLRGSIRDSLSACWPEDSGGHTA